MSEISQAVLDRPAIDSLRPNVGRRATAVDLAIYDELASVEDIWRQFERTADCTVFQSFDWLSLWHRHVGERRKVTPAIIVGRCRHSGEMLFLLPLAVWPGSVRRLAWLGSDLSDYNAPLIAANFTGSAAADQFPALWGEACKILQTRPHHRHDVVALTKMPETVGAQVNPMLMVGGALNPSGAHIAKLWNNWTEFYQAKCSRATRQRDRAKGRRLGQYGEVCLVTPQQRSELTTTLNTLFAQKAKGLARMGIPDMFGHPGYREFFLDLALNPATRRLVHISRLDVGPTSAAINFGLIFRGTYYHLIASYDDGEVSRFGPGAAHLRELLRHAIELGCERFDFTIGDEPYKTRWSDSTLNLYDYTAAATVRGWPVAGLILASRPLKRAIKQDARLWTGFTWLRSMIGSRVLGRGTASVQKTEEASESEPDSKR
jgi:CelD/BcsL family acetyltransferase involved in cellulose biosynthesis